MEHLERINAILNKCLVIVAGVCVLALMTLATGNVCFRIFGMPFRGAYEIVSFLGAVVTALALGYTQKGKYHIVVDILSDNFPAPIKRVLDGIGYAVAMAFFAVVAWVIATWGFQIAGSGEVSETLKIVYYPFIFCVAIGFAVLALTLAIDFLQTLRKEGVDRS